MWVKVCGITDLTDAEAAVRFGADAIGLVFAQSPRRVGFRRAQEICRAVAGRAKLVGVFMDARPEEIEETVSLLGLDLVQLHGDEDPELCERLSVPWIKAFKVKAPFDVSPNPMRYLGAEMMLFDSFDKGAAFDWDGLRSWLAARPELKGKKVVVAGGLCPENVAKALRALAPFGVDVSSGVEVSPGKKDHQKMERFIRLAKEIKLCGQGA